MANADDALGTTRGGQASVDAAAAASNSRATASPFASLGYPSANWDSASAMLPNKCLDRGCARCLGSRSLSQQSGNGFKTTEKCKG